MLQCGDPTGTGSGGPGYQFASENLSGARYTAGTLAMAQCGARAPTAASSSWCTSDSLSLHARLHPVRHIVKGLRIIQNVAKAGSDNANGPGDGHPKEKVVIKSVIIKKT